MPLHPSIVHLPLGLALVLPFIAAFAAWRLWKGDRSATHLVLFLSLALLGGNIAARQTGEGDEEIVERVVPHAVIEHHEEAADFFGLTVFAVVLLSIATVALGARKPARYTAAGVVVASLVTLLAGVKTGHDGGEIVYEHGGASAHLKAGGGAAPEQAGAPRDAD